jgi:hypothetical protein
MPPVVPGLRAIFAMLLCAGATAGCLPLALMAGAGLIDGSGDAPKLGNARPYGGPESSPQNGRYDPTVAEALRVSETEISEECRTALAAADSEDPDATRTAPAAPAQCETRPVCLPGFQKPVPMRLCPSPERR